MSKNEPITMQAGFQVTHWAQLYPPDAVTALAVNTEWELYVIIISVLFLLTYIYLYLLYVLSIL